MELDYIKIQYLNLEYVSVLNLQTWSVSKFFSSSFSSFFLKSALCVTQRKGTSAVYLPGQWQHLHPGVCIILCCNLVSVDEPIKDEQSVSAGGCDESCAAAQRQ